MATYTVSASNGERIAEVSFLSLPPGTEGSVYLGSGQKAGLVKSSYTGGEGTICNAQGDTVGTVFGSAFDDLCLAVSKNGKTVGGMKAHQVMRGTSPETWTPVATVSTSWTMSDDESVRQFEITMGRGDPGIGLSALAENIRHKERALAGVAALLLSQVGSGIEKMATAAPPASTVPTARVAPVTPSGIAYRSKTSFMSRLMGILFFRPSVYREIAEDTMATGQAAARVMKEGVV